MQLKSQDLEVVPVKFTGKSIGESYLGPDKDEEDNGTVHQQMDKHSDDEQYDMDSPVGYRNAIGQDWAKHECAEQQYVFKF